MELSDNDSEKLNKLSPIMKMFANTLLNGFERIINGECSEEEIAQTSSMVNNIGTNYKCPEDYLTVDKAMKILGFGQNRQGCINLLKKNGIVNEKFNNVPIGYNRNKVLALKAKIEDDLHKRILKQERKKKREILKARRKSLLK